jgi:hypothetical protein
VAILQRARMIQVHPFWLMGWYGRSDVLIGPSNLAHGRHCGSVQEW